MPQLPAPAIGPFEVASACLEHAAVREAAAIAAPDELRNINAFIVLAEHHHPSDELAEDIKRFVKGRLSAYAYPVRSNSSRTSRRH